MRNELLIPFISRLCGSLPVRHARPLQRDTLPNSPIIVRDVLDNGLRLITEQMTQVRSISIGVTSEVLRAEHQLRVISLRYKVCTGSRIAFWAKTLRQLIRRNHMFLNWNDSSVSIINPSAEEWSVRIWQEPLRKLCV